MPKGKPSKKQAVSEITKNVISFLDKLKTEDKEHKAELEKIKVETVNEVEMKDEGKKCYLIQLSCEDEKLLKKAHQTLVKKLEDNLNNHVVIIPSVKRINGKLYEKYISKTVPRKRTLTAVFDKYLDDVLYPATIIGKRIRYPSGSIRQFKVKVDPLDKELVENKLSAITACYKALTNRELDIEL